MSRINKLSLSCWFCVHFSGLPPHLAFEGTQLENNRMAPAMCLCLYTYFSVVCKAFYNTAENFLQFFSVYLLSSPETLHSFSITVQLLQVCQLSKVAPALLWGCFSWFHASFVNKMCKSTAAVQSTQSTGTELRARLAAGAPGSVKWRQCWRWAQLHPGWTCQSPELSPVTQSPQWHLQLC